MLLERVDSDEPSKGQLLIDAYEDGFNTFIGGFPADTNPHYRSTEPWQSWNRGWHTAKHGGGIKR